MNLKCLNPVEDFQSKKKFIKKIFQVSLKIKTFPFSIQKIL